MFLLWANSELAAELVPDEFIFPPSEVIDEWFAESSTFIAQS